MESVCVLPGMFPATIKVAPNSPIALANPRTTPANTPLYDKGRITARNRSQFVAPSNLAEFNISASIDSNAT